MDPTTRQSLRQALAARRRQLSATERARAAVGLARALRDWLPLRQARRIAGYWAHDGELPLNNVLALLNAQRQTFYLPVIKPHRHMLFAAWATGDPVTTNRYGIAEPGALAPTCSAAQLDVVLVPLLAYTARGGRLGYGGGYYDTTFAFLRQAPRPARPLLVGIGYAFQASTEFSTEDWDVPLDLVATDRGLVTCTAG